MGEYRDNLDEALGPIGSNEGVGTDVTVRRMDSSSNPVDATCRARVRSYRLRDDQIERSSDQGQDELLIIMSPTGLMQVGWPGSASGPPYPQRGDFVIIRGDLRAVNDCDPIYIGADLERVEMRVMGGG